MSVDSPEGRVPAKADVIPLSPPSAFLPRSAITETRKPEVQAAVPARTRLESVDIIRGIVMVVKALDHVRDYFTNYRIDPLDLSRTTVPLALTRWITHFCAPTFVFLAGTGAFLSLARGKTIRELSRFLLTRGLWLVFLELTLVRFGWMFNLNYAFMFGQVIWVIGWSMVVLSGLVFLPVTAVTVIGVVMILTHNLLDPIQPSAFGSFGWLWDVLHTPGNIEVARGHIFFALYPLIPWIGVMAAGFGFGRILQMETAKRRRTLYRLGAVLVLAFVALRASNLYGDPRPWQQQGSFAFTVLSFINCQKYPPSLLYLLMTLGPGILLLPLLERWKGWAADFFVTFGRVPLFYYVIHVPFIHALAVIAAYFTVHDASMMFSNLDFESWLPAYGFSLPVVYLVWIGVVLALYPLCRWYAGVKRKSKNPLLSYL
jgi:uncharacterized membrane protein